MPETVAPHLDEVSEEALRERVQLRKVMAAVELYDQLLQAGSYTALQRHLPLLKKHTKLQYDTLQAQPSLWKPLTNCWT